VRKKCSSFPCLAHIYRHQKNLNGGFKSGQTVLCTNLFSLKWHLDDQDYLVTCYSIIKTASPIQY